MIIRACKGEGYQIVSADKTIKVPKFTPQNQVLEYENEGHETAYFEKGDHGDLKILVKVENDPQLRREGVNIISKHYITLTDAILGCDVHVNTVKGTEKVSL
jgi:molecular chaperone DnaJ